MSTSSPRLKHSRSWLVDPRKNQSWEGRKYHFADEFYEINEFFGSAEKIALWKPVAIIVNLIKNKFFSRFWEI